MGGRGGVRDGGQAAQCAALRSVVKQAHGGAASAADTQTAGYLWRGELYPRERRPARALLEVGSDTSMSCVFVVDGAQHPCTPVHPGAARRLLTRGQAAVWRRYPFTLILQRTTAPAASTATANASEPSLPATPAPLRLKIDPGSKTTGLALVDDATGQVVWAGEISHRGQRVRDALLARQAIRHGRRQRHTRYRPQRCDNRQRPKGWLPPSLASPRANRLRG